ncbi:E3 ubiquitin-protein ligase NRDP1-like protein, partial [Dinothrombium tinctorium]
QITESTANSSSILLTHVDFGYESSRFVNLAEFSVDLNCPICYGIFREPVITTCNHLFCKNCINVWSMESKTCPVDRRTLTKLQEPPISVEDVMNKLLIKCDYEQFGCKEIIELPLLEQHLKRCNFNQDLNVDCGQRENSFMCKFKSMSAMSNSGGQVRNMRFIHVVVYHLSNACRNI